jgi:hypothetical protein
MTMGESKEEPKDAGADAPAWGDAPPADHAGEYARHVCRGGEPAADIEEAARFLRGDGGAPPTEE